MLPEPTEDEIAKYRKVVSYIEAFQREGAPLAFKWVEWTAILSVLRFVEARTEAWPISALCWVLAILLWQHFVWFFARSYDWRPYKEVLSRAGIAEWLLGLAAAAAMVMASLWFADLLAQHPF